MSLAQRFEEVREGFERSFWVANVSEIFERLAYYGSFASLANYLRETLVPCRSGVIAKPILPLLTGVNHIPQIGARGTHLAPGHRPKVRDRERFLRRRRKEEVADGRVGRLRVVLNLLQSRLNLTRFPLLKLWKLRQKIVHGEAGAVTRPTQEFGSYFDSHHRCNLTMQCRRCRGS